MNEKVYLVGGNGFIGKNLVKILSNIYDITVFDKNIDCDYFRNYNIQTVKMDLVEEIIPDSMPDPDFIINLASIVTAERDIALFDSLISSNLKILLNLFARFRETKRLKMFMQFGSSEEYGSAPSPYKEEMREEPNSPYALIKQLTTNTALMLYRNYGFPAMVVRPGNLFGPGQNPTKFIPYVLAQLKSGQPLNVTLCEQKRDFIYIDDFAHSIKSIIINYKDGIGRIINISSGVSISLKDIIEKFRDSLHSTSIVQYGALPYRENEAMNLCCDTSRLDEILKKERLNKSLQDICKVND